MKMNSLNAVQISGLSDAKFKCLVDRLGNLGLTVTLTDNRCNVTGQDIAGSLSHDPSTETLTVELNQFPSVVTPGHLLGRLYDEILSMPQS